MKALVDAEEWRDILGYEGLYQVSSHGRVRSLDKYEVGGGKGGKHKRLRKGRVMKQGWHEHGYRNIILSKDYKQKTFSVHRLVAIAFVPNPDNLPEVNHLEEVDKLQCNNHYTNLVWCTRSQNALHSSYKNRGEVNNRSKLTEAEVLEIKELILAGSRQIDIAEQFSVTNCAIFRIQHGYNWRWLTGFERRVIR